MAELSSHAPGTFSWVELATTDQAAGVAFYRALFGWDVDEQPIGPGEVYSMFQLRGRAVGAGHTLRAQDRQAGVPPHWNLYITVASADETVTRARGLGGRVLVPSFDVMDAGRMAVLQDPAGAAFCVWEPKNHIGAGILSAPGALCWSELATRDMQAAEAFYTALFGWAAKRSAPGAPMQYTEFDNHSGMMAMPDGMPASVPSYWMPYFQVVDCDARAANVTELGGSVMVPARDIPGTGRFAIVSDPQGAMFAMFTFAAA